MDRRPIVLVAAPLLLAAPAGGQMPLPAASRWSAATLAELHRWIAAAPDDGLPAPDAGALEAAERVGDAATTDRAADGIALRLAAMHLRGCCAVAAHAGWHITDTDTTADLPARLDAALARGTLAPFIAAVDPVGGDYAALRAAHAAERDPARRALLARNLERWRWLPRDPAQGAADAFLLVNTAAFEVRYWAHGRLVGRWPVINGKPSSPTPIFMARVSAVTFNPWWEIPPNIVREGIGALAAKNPAAARAKGYVWSAGRFRQRPGPGNALGAMKLVMPNPFNVYLHDTPTKQLFARPVRAFSHGCIRVSDALGFATTLLGPATDRAGVDAIVAGGQTTTMALLAPVPVYIAYFTAGVDAEGKVATYPDIYGRDAALGDAKDNKPFCAA